jgi:hypothetical protein
MSCTKFVEPPIPRYDESELSCPCALGTNLSICSPVCSESMDGAPGDDHKNHRLPKSKVHNMKTLPIIHPGRSISDLVSLPVGVGLCLIYFDLTVANYWLGLETTQLADKS